VAGEWARCAVFSFVGVKPLRDRADHGVPLIDNAGRRLPLVWVRTHDQYYRDTTLRHPARDARDAHDDRDVFQELVAPARERRMKIYARVLESSAMSRVVANYATVVTRDVNDRPRSGATSSTGSSGAPSGDALPPSLRASAG
jgi:hypothetical protein